MPSDVRKVQAVQQERLAEGMKTESTVQPAGTSLLDRLPVELLDMISEKTESMTRQEAETYRLELMKERTAFVGDQDKAYFSTKVNMCEH